MLRIVYSENSEQFLWENSEQFLWENNEQFLWENKLVIVQEFNWLSRHVMYYFMDKWVWLCASIINTKPMS